MREYWVPARHAPPYFFSKSWDLETHPYWLLKWHIVFSVFLWNTHSKKSHYNLQRNHVIKDFFWRWMRRWAVESSGWHTDLSLSVHGMLYFLMSQQPSLCLWVSEVCLKGCSLWLMGCFLGQGFCLFLSHACICSRLDLTERGNSLLIRLYWYNQWRP